MYMVCVWYVYGMSMVCVWYGRCRPSSFVRRPSVVVRPSSSSVRRRPSVVVRRRRLATNPRPHAHFRKQMQNMSPTATGLLNSESTQKLLQIPSVKSEKYPQSMFYG